MTNPQQELELYSIKDLKIQKFLPPFFASNREEATRLMREQVNYKSSLINSFPSDYELYFLGTFSDFTGEIANDNPQLVCNLEALKQDDSKQYDELLAQTKNLQAQVDASILRFNNAMTDFSNTFNSTMKSWNDRFFDFIASNQVKIDDLIDTVTIDPNSNSDAKKNDNNNIIKFLFK